MREIRTLRSVVGPTQKWVGLPDRTLTSLQCVVQAASLQKRLFNRGKVQRLIYSYKERYPSLKDWKCHDLRHSFAYNFLKRGGEMYQLKAILGHKTIQMTVDLYGNLKAVDVENPSAFDF